MLHDPLHSRLSRLACLTALPMLLSLGVAASPAQAEVRNVFGKPGIAGSPGGDASLVVGPSPDPFIYAGAIGGRGGSSSSVGATAGSGGQAAATASGSAPSGRVIVQSYVGGGDGGTGSGGANGGFGADAEAINTVSGATSGQLILTQTAYGGAGGDGQQGGDGGSALSTLDLSGTNAIQLIVTTQATGGGGGPSVTGLGGAAGHAFAGSIVNNAVAGGVASSSAYANGGGGGLSSQSDGANGGDSEATATGYGNGAVMVGAYSQGGKGGDASGVGFVAGAGGNPSATAYGESSGTGNFNVKTVLTGGAGGSGFAGAIAGDGASVSAYNSVAAVSATGLTPSMILSQSVAGGNGGDSNGGSAGWGGDAESFLNITDGSTDSLYVRTNATGGSGGTAFNTPLNYPPSVSIGGDALAITLAVSTREGAMVTANSVANGGFHGGPDGYDGFATASASASTIGGGYAEANAIASGYSGSAEAEASTVATDGASYAASSAASIGLDGAATAAAQADVGSAPIRMNLTVPTGAYAAIVGMPSLTDGDLPTPIATTFASVPGEVLAIGFMGAKVAQTANQTYTASVDFDVLGKGTVPFILGLYGGTSGAVAGLTSAVFSVAVDSVDVATKTFSTASSALAFLTDNTWDLGSYSANQHVTFSYAFTGSNGQGLAFNYAFARGTTAVPGPVAGAGLPALLLITGYLGYVRRRGKAKIGAGVPTLIQ